MGARLSLSAEERSLYPVESLQGLRTALVGFCAAFLGRQDCVWIEEAGITATGVDLDAERLFEMAALYPDDWTFVCDDVFEYARRRYAEGRTYDLVSLDPPTNLFELCDFKIDLWCALARRVIVLGTGLRPAVATPEGWRIASVIRRSSFRGGTYWMALERA